MRAAEMGITDPDRVYDVIELASGDVLVSATGGTDGTLLEGHPVAPQFGCDQHCRHALWSQTVRWIKARHAR